MEITHKIQYVNGSKIVQIMVNYPSEYEFSIDINKFKENVHNVSIEIKKYIHDNFQNIKNITFVLVLNGIVIGSILLPALNQISDGKYDSNISQDQDTEQLADSNTNNIANTDMLKKNNLSNSSSEDLANQNIEKESINPAGSTNTSSTANQEKFQTTEVKNTNSVTTNTNIPKTNTNSATSNTNIPQANTQSTTTEKASTQSQTVKVKLSSGQIITVDIDNYLTGVVGGEMPASFNIEALKAQALAARTYTYKNINRTLSASTTDQVYKTDSELKNMWGNSYSTYYNKVHNAVTSTENQYISYNGNYIDALYFSTSNGKTEDAKYVWGNSVPYLKSVDSHWDIGIKSYSGSKIITLSKLNSTLSTNVKSDSDIKILSKTSGDRINNISFNGKVFTGVNIRSSFNLKSADFDIHISGDTVTFTTRGYGHGVGMSQYGANAMANAGYNYQQIIKHYYTGIDINTK